MKVVKTVANVPLFPFVRSFELRFLNAVYMLHSTDLLQTRVLGQEELFVPCFDLSEVQSEFVKRPPRDPVTRALSEDGYKLLIGYLASEVAGDFVSSSDPHNWSPFPFKFSAKRPVFNLLAQLYLEPYVRYQLVSSCQDAVKWDEMMREYDCRKQGVIFKDIAKKEKVSVDHIVFDLVKAEILGPDPAPVFW